MLGLYATNILNYISLAIMNNYYLFYSLIIFIESYFLMIILVLNKYHHLYNFHCFLINVFIIISVLS